MPRRPNAARWRDRVSRQLKSGLSVEQFCARERCSRSALYRWKGQLALMPPPDQCPTLPAPSTFLPVSVRLVASDADQPTPIEADLPNGIRLHIPTANIQLACHLVRAIARATTDSGGSR